MKNRIILTLPLLVTLIIIELFLFAKAVLHDGFRWSRHLPLQSTRVVQLIDEQFWVKVLIGLVSLLY